MQISHEVPLALLEKSRSFNDYDFCLIHLLDKYEDYLLFFKQSLELGREVILDNSVFELDKSYTLIRIADWVESLEPTEFIIPDVLENAEETIENVIRWDKWFFNIPGKKIGVVQGKTYEELANCYQELDKWVDKIAFPFNLSYYQEIKPYKNKLVSWMEGRIAFIQKLMSDGVLNKKKPHHLLGCSLPQEFKHYRHYDFIESVDTSNPIVHGLLRIEYSNEGLEDKSTIKMKDLMERKIENEKTIMYNVKMFRSFCEK